MSAGLVALLTLLGAADGTTLRDEGQRVRFGGSAFIGFRVMHVDAPLAAAPGAELRLGWQATSRFGFVVGGAMMFAVPGASAYGRATVLAEVTLVDHLVAAFGSVLAVGRTVAFIDAFTLTSGAQPELAPGLTARLVLATARRVPPTFSGAGMSLGLELLVLWHPQLATPGFSSPYWSFTPTFSVGFDTW